MFRAQLKSQTTKLKGKDVCHYCYGRLSYGDHKIRAGHTECTLKERLKPLLFISHLQCEDSITTFEDYLAKVHESDVSFNLEINDWFKRRIVKQEIL